MTTDLSKAFDCLPANLLHKKLLAYGFSQSAALLLYNYLTGRSQCVKIGSTTSSYTEVLKGTPQGSKLGPVLYNYLCNDLLYYLPINSLVNYADDNTIIGISDSPKSLGENLTNTLNKLQYWYRQNGMQPNPDKYQSIVLSRNSNNSDCEIFVENTNIPISDEVTLLGCTIDNQLTFNKHITAICIRAANS